MDYPEGVRVWIRSSSEEELVEVVADVDEVHDLGGDEDRDGRGDIVVTTDTDVVLEDTVEPAVATPQPEPSVSLSVGVVSTPQAELARVAAENAEELAQAALDGALDPELSVDKRAQNAMRVIRLTNPNATARVDKLTLEDIDRLSTSELFALAESRGIKPAE